MDDCKLSRHPEPPVPRHLEAPITRPPHCEEEAEFWTWYATPEADQAASKGWRALAYAAWKARGALERLRHADHVTLHLPQYKAERLLKLMADNPNAPLAAIPLTPVIRNIRPKEEET